MGLEQVRPISRRSLIKGAAWGAPVIAVALAAPLAAASACTEWTQVEAGTSVPSSTNLRANYQQRTLTITVPAGVTSMQFDVAGGGGGVNYNPDAATDQPGGDGHRITGTIAVVPGTTLTLIAGNGGIGVNTYGGSLGFGSIPAPVTIYGGEGYGNGGNISILKNNLSYAAGSGGGGSAILIGGAAGTPLVVAGGGGGGGGSVMNSTNLSLRQDARGGDGGFGAATLPALQSGGAWQGSFRSTGNIVVCDGGRGANGAAVGTPGTGNSAGGTSTTFTTGKAGAGRNGGDGVPSGEYVDGTSAYSYTSGAGGGGFAGGASGNAALIKRNSTFSVIFGAAAGGGGGGGSSYVLQTGANRVTAFTGSTAGNGRAQALSRAGGWAKVRWGNCNPA